MSNYQLTQTAKEDLDFECSECDATTHPEVVDREESRTPLVDHRITVACRECGNESQSNVWDRDIEEVDQ